jgi:hypothetical protein
LRPESPGRAASGPARTQPGPCFGVQEIVDLARIEPTTSSISMSWKSRIRILLTGLIEAQGAPAAVLVKPGLPRVAVIGKAGAGNVAQAIEDLVSGRAVNCRILSEDLKAGQTISGIRIETPFAAIC